jgi:hypothetical protein
MPELNKVVAWPDGEWLWESDFEDGGGEEGHCHGSWSKSDDYEYIDIPEYTESLGEEAVHEFVQQHVNRGLGKE